MCVYLLITLIQTRALRLVRLHVRFRQPRQFHQFGRTLREPSRRSGAACLCDTSTSTSTDTSTFNYTSTYTDTSTYTSTYTKTLLTSSSTFYL